MNWLKATFIFLITFILGYSNLQGQTREDLTSVPKVGQKSDSWCWAASMEMVFKHYNFPYTQCDVGKRFFERKSLVHTGDLSRIRGTDNAWTLTPNWDNIQELKTYCQDWCDSPDDWSMNRNFFQTLPFNYDTLESGNYEAAYFHMLFSDFDFFSIEDIIPLPWYRYKAEIQNKRPVILNYSIIDIDTDASGAPFDHAVVAKGYLEDTNNSYFIVQDPLTVCDGREYLLNKAVLDGIQEYTPAESITPVPEPLPSGLRVGRIYSMIHGIRPKNPNLNPFHSNTPVIVSRKINKNPFALTVSFQDPNPKPPLDINRLISILKEERGNFLGSALKGTFSEERIKAFKPNAQFLTEIDLISYKNLNKFWPNCSLEKGKVSSINTKEVTYTQSSPEIKAIIRCTEDGKSCMIEKIAFQEDSGKKEVSINGKTFTLSNQSQGENILPYRIAKYPPYSIEFYTISNENENYFIPKDNYTKAIFNGANSQNKLIAYSEKEAFKKLVKHTKDFPWKTKPFQIDWERLISIMIIFLIPIIILTNSTNTKGGTDGIGGLKSSSNQKLQ